ncbi:MAG: asparagine synthase (glutamine-hydrolyzing) [Flavobacteriaceae bacterium]|nr:asparagine synthase (glutamine-hydrolyzing) [Flavobacteriaceae bacterium]
MCGIAGIIGINASQKTMAAMLKKQQHRGPDNTGIFSEDNIVLGHNRLSIIDLSEGANQPFHSPDGRYILVFNGEIYNYKELRSCLKNEYVFKTQSDTEVLLAAYISWGEECLARLNGMFAFAIWDRKGKQLFAARDRFGVKPFYYAYQDDTFYFASELKTLFEAGLSRVANEKVWATYFAYGSYGMPHETFWEGVFQLSAGHSMVVAQGRFSITQWYNFENEIKKQSEEKPLEQAVTTYLGLLEDSIALRFRADVPLGFNISGGVDSSLLLALVNKHKKGGDIRAFTFYTGDERYDELPWVEELIVHTSNPLHKVKLAGQQVPELSRLMASQQDEPYGGFPTLAYASLFAEARKRGVKVVLDGQGMDEQWAGYDYYRNTEGETIQGVRKSPFRPGVLSADFLARAEKPEYREPFENSLLNLQYRDLFYTKLPRALRFNDRISMAASTELREPFLDHRLVEFAFAQPRKYKIQGDLNKYVLRLLVKELLPESISLAPKRALQTPQREWLGDDLKSWTTERILSLKGHPWFQSNKLEKELEKYLSGNRDSSFHIWQWINCSLLFEPDGLL